MDDYRLHRIWGNIVEGLYHHQITMPSVSSTGDAPFMPRSASVSGTRPISQLARHGKYVAIGTAGVWYCDALNLVREAMDAESDGSWLDKKGTASHR